MTTERTTTRWICTGCSEEQIAWGAVPVPADGRCNSCRERQAAVSVAEREAEIPASYRRYTRESWAATFGREWPARVATWTGTPHWLAVWGPTGTGKTGLATVLLAEHVRAGRRGRWVSGALMADKIRADFRSDNDPLAPYRATGLLVLDEPLAAAGADWYLERLGLLCRLRDERGLPTIVTAQQLTELLDTTPPGGPPALLSRWLSGVRLHLKGDDVRLGAAR